MNLSSVRRRYTIIEHGLQIVSGYSSMGVRRSKSSLSCFVLFCFVLFLWWWCLGFSKYHQGLLAESLKEPIAKGFKSGGWVGKSCSRVVFFIMPTTQQQLTYNLSQT